MDKLVSVILLNYNGAEDTITCLQSLEEISYVNYRVTIIDNASTDDSVAKIEEYLKLHNINEYLMFDSSNDAMDARSISIKYTLIQAEHNGGYGYGNNIGIKFALKNDADYVLVLNNDTVVDSNFLEPMVQMCEEDRHVGIASGKIFFYDRPDTIWFNGGKFLSCLAKVEHFNFNEKDVGQMLKKPVTFISGCMWLIPKKVFSDVGFINEKYFMYMEDLEFCQRVLTKGYKLEIATDSNILHRVGGSGTGQLSSFSVYYRARNKISFIFVELKYFCKIQALLSIIFLESFRYVYKKRLDLLTSHLKGVVNGLLRKH